MTELWWHSVRIMMNSITISVKIPSRHCQPLPFWQTIIHQKVGQDGIITEILTEFCQNFDGIRQDNLSQSWKFIILKDSLIDCDGPLSIKTGFTRCNSDQNMFWHIASPLKSFVKIILTEKHPVTIFPSQFWQVSQNFNFDHQFFDSTLSIKNFIKINAFPSKLPFFCRSFRHNLPLFL